MNVRHPMGALHSFSIKNIFCDKAIHLRCLQRSWQLLCYPPIPDFV